MTLRHSLDSTVLESLEKLWALRSGEDYLGQVLSHPSLRDGIMDDRTNVVAVLDKVVERRPELLDVLLDPGQAIVKECSITLLLAGGVALSVISPRVAASDERASRTIALLEHAVRHHEEFMSRRYYGASP